VRFKPGTLASAQRAMLSQVDAMAGPSLTYADFDIVTLAGGGEAVVAVYTDPAVGGTGVTVHRASLGAP
jgi:hypothetical protein